MAAPTINLTGRVPVIQRAFSNRLVWLGMGLVVLFLGAVVFGFRYRLQKQEARKEIQQAQTTASDAATSNRQQVEGGQGLPSSHLIGLASSGSAHSRRTHLQERTPWQPATQPPPVAYQTTYYPAHLAACLCSSPLQRNIHHRRAMLETPLSHAEQRRQQAIEAPTGEAEQQRASAAPSASTPASDLSLLNSLTPAISGGGQMAASPHDGFGPLAAAHDPNDQGGKRLFTQGGEQSTDDSLKTTRMAPGSPWVVQRGTVIPAVLPSKVVSDLPGDLIAEVARDVYDSPTQQYVEIPAGSRLLGEYNSSVSYGQNRVQIVWIAVYFPDGSYIDLDRMPSHSADGATGLKDQVDNHWGRIVGGVALSSLLAAGLQISQNRTNGSVLTYPSTGQEIGAAVGTQASELGQQITNRNMNVQPTLRIRPGEVFAVSVKKDILFDGPYQPLRESR